MQFYKFPNCDCQFEILGPPIGKSLIPCLNIDIENLPFCPRTYELFATGNTKNIFQCEAKLGRTWSRILIPKCIDDISALIAIIRPGTLRAISDGMSMTEKYCKLKNKLIEHKPYQDNVDTILAKTNYCIIYQETILELVKELAGFTLTEANQARIAVGKKLPAEMAKVKFGFIDGCKKRGLITETQAEEVFEWIEKSQRYLFVKSHSLSYGLRAYRTAFIKSHDPLGGVLVSLKFAKNHQSPKEEMANVINDGKLFGITVEPPDFTLLKKHFNTDGEKVFFGLTDVSGVGESTITKAKALVAEKEAILGKSLKDFSWLDFLLNIATGIKSDSMKAIILVGAMRKITSLSRQQMLNDLESVLELTEKELFWVLNNKSNDWKTLVDALRALSLPRYQKPKTKKNVVKPGPYGGCHSAAREEKVRSLASLLEKPPTTNLDTAMSVSSSEERLLGIALSCSKVDSCDLSSVTMNIKEFLTGANSSCMIFGVHIDEIKMMKTKKGKSPGATMCSLIISDESGSSNAVVFPKEYSEFSSVLSIGNDIAFEGMKLKDGGLMMKRAFQLYMGN